LNKGASDETNKFEYTGNLIVRGMRLVYLPPYSPDFNPIEEAFLALKAWIQWNRDYVNAELTGEVDCDPYEML
jgi:hypothetical protein